MKVGYNNNYSIEKKMEFVASTISHQVAKSAEIKQNYRKLKNCIIGNRSEISKNPSQAKVRHAQKRCENTFAELSVGIFLFPPVLNGSIV